MRRVIIIGSPGAGKSTFSQKLSDVTGLPLYHLDLLYHRADHTIVSRSEFDQQLAQILEQNAWILDGNYQRTMEWRMEACDTVFLLDYPTELCLAGAKSRIGQSRADFPWVAEQLEDELQQKILNFSTDKLPQIYELLHKYQAEKNIIIFQTRTAADSYLQQLAVQNKTNQLDEHGRDPLSTQI